MALLDLPELCLQRIASGLAEHDGCWRLATDVARDAGALAIASHGAGDVGRSVLEAAFGNGAARACRGERKQLVSASVARATYGLSDGELARLPCVLTQNPVVRHGPPMRLYRLVEVVAAAKARYGSLEGYQAALRRRAQRAEAHRAALAKASLARKAALDAALEAHPTPLREAVGRVAPVLWADPYKMHVYGGQMRLAAVVAKMAEYGRRLLRLEAVLKGWPPTAHACEVYVNTGAGDPVAIAAEVEETGFLYERTNYARLLQAYAPAFERLDEAMLAAKDQALATYARAPGCELAPVPDSLRPRVAREGMVHWASEALAEAGVPEAAFEALLKRALRLAAECGGVSSAVERVVREFEATRRELHAWLWEDHRLTPGDVCIPLKDLVGLTREELGRRAHEYVALMTRHMRLEHLLQKRDGEIECSVCRRRFGSWSALSSHVVGMHPTTVLWNA